jgi:hypothetical protein
LVAFWKQPGRAWPLGPASVEPGRPDTETNHVSRGPGSECSAASLGPNQHTYPPTKQTYFGYVDAADVRADNQTTVSKKLLHAGMHASAQTGYQSCHKLSNGDTKIKTKVF